MRSARLHSLLPKRPAASSATNGPFCTPFLATATMVLKRRRFLPMPDHERGCIRPVSRHDLAASIELCVEHATYEGASYDPQGKVKSLTRALFAPIHACTPGLSSSVVAWWDMRRRLRSFPPGRLPAFCIWIASTCEKKLAVWGWGDSL